MFSLIFTSAGLTPSMSLKVFGLAIASLVVLFPCDLLNQKWFQYIGYIAVTQGRQVGRVEKLLLVSFGIDRGRLEDIDKRDVIL